MASAVAASKWLFVQAELTRTPQEAVREIRLAEALADRVIVTSDNPRGEDPRAIINAILGGMKRAPAVQADRTRAVVEAVVAADTTDVILIAGKGHEPYQEIAGVRHPYSDLATAKSALEMRR